MPNHLNPQLNPFTRLMLNLHPFIALQEENSVDNKPVVFRFKTWLLYTFIGWFAILILASFGVPIVLGVVTLQFLEFDWAENFNFMFSGGLIFLFLLSMLNVVVSAYMIRFFWKYRLIFGKTRFGHKTIPYPFIKPFAQRYEDILKVTRGEYRGTIKIVPKTGKPLQIRANVFEGGTERLLEAFSARFRPEQMDPELRETLWKFTKLDRISWGVSAIYFFFIMIFLFGKFSFSPWSLETRWWKPIPKTNGYVSAYSIDSDGSIWAIARTGFSDNKYKVWHISDQREESWLFTKETTDDSFDFPHQVAHDGNGNPWIFFDNDVYYWNNGKWIETTFPHAELNDISSILHWIVSDSNIWTLIYPDNNDIGKIAHWDLSNGQFEIIALPEGQPSEYREKIELSPNGNLVLFRYPRESIGQINIYQLDDVNWKLITAYQIPEKISFSNYRFDAITDQQGFTWLLLPFNDNSQIVVARFNPMTMAWDETSLPGQNSEGGTLTYNSLEIDPKGRIWTEGIISQEFDDSQPDYKSFVAAIQPNWGSTSSIIQLYTDANSNLGFGMDELKVDKTGRVWSPDGKWVDGNVENLPQPLPDGISMRTLNNTFPLAIFVSQFPLIGILYYFQRKIERENTSKIQPQPST